MRSDKENIIVKLTFDFSIKIIKFSEELRKIHKYEMASQVFRSGTSIVGTLASCANHSRTESCDGAAWCDDP